MRTQMFITAGLALALSAPAALAFWSGHGSFEPDYPGDVSAGLMFPDPDWDPNPEHKQVYFNAFMEPEGTNVNPNVGALQSRVIGPDFQFPTAYLGVWKDCNKDGYIGLAESALIVYRNELLALDNTVCPPGTSDFNRDGWVYEFLWIGPADNSFFPEAGESAPRMINDIGARVWGDIGLAGDDLSGGVSCFVNPQTGTFSGTGALLAYADCNTGYAIAEAINGADPTGLLGFENPRQPQCSDSLLNVRLNVFNDEPKCPTGQPGLLEQQPEDDRQAAFTAFDCDAGTPTPVPAGPADQNVTFTNPATGEDGWVDPADEDGNLATVFVPGASADPAVNPTGSYFEAANNTYTNVVDACAPESAGLIAPGPFAESSVTSDSSYQRETNWAFTFQGYTGTNLAAGFLDIFVGPGGTAAALGGAPSDGGQGIATHVADLGLAPAWTSPVGSTVEPWLIRSDLTPAGPQYYTFYARVTESTQLTLPGGSGFYGAEWCNGVYDAEVASAAARGFDCDAANWWDQSKGASAMPTEVLSGRAVGQVPGAAYNLRDVDCYDGTATSLAPELRGVGLGLSTLSETEPPCAYYVAE